MGVLLAALDSLHGICQRCTSFSSIKQGGVEGMDKNFGGCNRDRPQGHKGTLSTSSEEGSGQSHYTVCRHFTVGLLVRPAAIPTRISSLFYQATTKHCYHVVIIFDIWCQILFN